MEVIKEALELDPTNMEILNTEKIQLEVKRKQYNLYLDRAKNNQASGKLVEALSDLELAKSIFDSKEISKSIEEIQSKIGESNKLNETNRINELIHKFLEKSSKLVEEKLYQEALEELEKALGIDSGNMEVLYRKIEIQTLFELHENAFKFYKRKAEESLMVKKWDEAISLYKQALDIKINDPDCLKRFQNVIVERDREQQNRLDEINKKMQIEEQAKTKLEDAQKKIEGRTENEENAIKIEALCKAADKLVTEKKFVEALSEIVEALSILDGHLDITIDRKVVIGKKNSIQDHGYKYYCNEANISYNSRKFGEAAKFYNEALKIRPGDKDCTEKLELLKKPTAYEGWNSKGNQIVKGSETDEQEKAQLKQQQGEKHIADTKNHIHEQKNKEAEKSLSEARKLVNNSGEIQSDVVNLTDEIKSAKAGNTSFEKREFKKEKQEYEKALEKYPEDSQSKARLIEISSQRMSFKHKKWIVIGCIFVVGLVIGIRYLFIPSTKIISNPNDKVINLDYGIYHGEDRAGIMHGKGTLRYSKPWEISAASGLKAEAGDSVEGEWYEGNVLSGKLYSSRGKSMVDFIKHDYGVYQGEVMAGKMHGRGTLRYSKPCKLSVARNLMAEAGDSVVGTWDDGELSKGMLYYMNNNKSQEFNFVRPIPPPPITDVELGAHIDSLNFVEPIRPLSQYGTSAGPLDVGYGTYIGKVKNNKMHGKGTLTYFYETRIKDTITAQPGDLMKGKWSEGSLEFGTLFYNSRKDSISIKIGRL